jgi:hypothetical protein
VVRKYTAGGSKAEARRNMALREIEAPPLKHGPRHCAMQAMMS